MATAWLSLQRPSLAILCLPIAAVWQGDWEACLDPVLLEAAGEVVNSLGTPAEGTGAQQGQQQQMVAVNQPPMAEYRFQVRMRDACVTSTTKSWHSCGAPCAHPPPCESMHQLQRSLCFQCVCCPPSHLAVAGGRMAATA